jgi:hypothetical protein
MYLHCLTGDRPHQWLQWLPWVEFCYNSSYQASIRTSPFRVVYSRDPPSLRTYTAGEAKLPAVQTQLQERDEFLAEIRGRLEQAQQHYKLCYDHHRRDVQFAVGDWVWLCLLHRPLTSLNNTNRSKLGPKFYGPFQILERIGDVNLAIHFLSRTLCLSS